MVNVAVFGGLGVVHFRRTQWPIPFNALCNPHSTVDYVRATKLVCMSRILHCIIRKFKPEWAHKKTKRETKKQKIRQATKNWRIVPSTALIRLTHFVIQMINKQPRGNLHFVVGVQICIATVRQMKHAACMSGTPSVVGNLFWQHVLQSIMATNVMLRD